MNGSELPRSLIREALKQNIYIYTKTDAIALSDC